MVDYLIEDHIATLTFNRPERANALDVAGWEGLHAACERADVDPEVRVVILTGAGKHFCAGMDLMVLTGLQQELGGQKNPTKAVREFITKIQDCITAIERCRKPVIAAIDGGCIGGGVDLVTACDMRYCTDQAYFTVKEVDLGIVADIGTLQRLPRLINPSLAAELAYTGRKMEGPEAARSGLVSASLKSRAELLRRVRELASLIAAKPPVVIAGIKRNLLYQRDHSVADSLKFVAGYSADLITGRGRG